MVRSVVKKVMWVGRATMFMVGLAMILALLLGVASMALGANGNPIILGKAKNTASKVTGLVGNLADTTKPALRVTNTKGGSALELRVGDPAANPATKSVAPMKVDSQAKVANLNADQLDGKDSTAFQPLVLQGGDHTESQPPNFRGCTKEDTWTECGKVTVFVPAGETWTVAIDSGGSFFKWNAATRVRFCTSVRRSTEAVQGSNCVNTPTAVTTNNEVVAAATNGVRELYGGPSGTTWVISTLVYPDDPLDWYNGYDYVVLHTLVTVYPYDAAP
jgi:hypothetical protein